MGAWKEKFENTVQSGKSTLMKTSVFYLLRRDFYWMIRAKYWEATRSATTDGQVGCNGQSATGKRAVFSLAVRILLAKIPHPSHNCWESLCKKGLRHVRGRKSPSHNPHKSLTCLSSFRFILIKWRYVGMMWGISEGFVRDKKHPSHSLTPLNKGVPRENVRDELLMYSN